MIAPWFAKLDRAAEALATNKKALVTSLVAHFALAEEGKLPGRRIGEHWRFSRPALVAWLSRVLTRNVRCERRTRRCRRRAS